MDRRQFIRWSSIVAAGAIAADQLEILERLTHVRRLFPGADLITYGKMGVVELLDPTNNARVLRRIPWDGQKLFLASRSDAQRVLFGQPNQPITIPNDTRWFRLRVKGDPISQATAAHVAGIYQCADSNWPTKELVYTLPGPAAQRESRARKPHSGIVKTLSGADVRRISGKLYGTH